jgi:hypothetical protein
MGSCGSWLALQSAHRAWLPAIIATSVLTYLASAGRCHPALPAARGNPVRVEHEYVRHGALALLAGQVMARPGYHNAPSVFVIADNGSDHRGQAAIDRTAKARPNAIMIHTPVHASRLN